MIGTKRFTSKVNRRTKKGRTSHTERLHIQAVLTFSLEQLWLDLGLDITSLPRHNSFETVTQVNRTLVTDVDKIASLVEELISYSVKVRFF